MAKNGSVMFSAIMLVCLFLSSPFASMRVRYFGYHVENDTLYAVFKMESTNLFSYPADMWHYAINDTIWTDTGGYAVTAIDTAANRATIDTVGKGVTGRRRSPELAGLPGDGTIVFDRSIIRITALTKTSVTLRCYRVPFEKRYVSEEDTIRLEGNSISGVHLYEEKIPRENCREFIIPDTLVTHSLWDFFLNGVCEEERLQYRINSNGIALETGLCFELNAQMFLDTLTLSGDIDSMEMTVNRGEPATIPYDGTVITPVWIMKEDYSKYAQAAGFLIAESTDVRTRKASQAPANRCTGLGISATREEAVNLLGRSHDPRVRPSGRIRIQKAAAGGKRVIIK